VEPETRDERLVEARLRLALELVQRELDGDQVRLLRERLLKQIEASHALREVPRTHGDEPAPGFDPSVPSLALGGNAAS